MSIQSGQTYVLTNVKGGTALDLSGGDNKSLIGFQNHGGGNQQWQLSQENSGWVFRNVGTGKYLGVEGRADDGVPVVAVDSPFIWNIWPDEKDGSVYRVFVPNTAYNIDLSDHGNSEPGTKVTLWWKWEGTNQTWRFNQV
ncbi:carbohydrate-binding module family 13 protein [Plicaturopsis crispa FD-325 SS-3]|uniref:Carbohydrate-binding module family 13 protein n=1 Tax=Plicaturopsis crispa FD-325 SS-3 TaxID=944288 RepID=A0A0C9SL57_PLICR|nr:carbohydrate-binding module family 13 protein [Plicaturopsis crispa FD-325 SS-3]